jgi:hypothetical protein
LRANGARPPIASAQEEKGKAPDGQAQAMTAILYVQCTGCQMNRFLRPLIWWEKKLENCLRLPHFACAWDRFSRR